MPPRQRDARRATLQPAATAPQPSRRVLVSIAAAMLITVHFVLLLCSVRHKSSTYDELVHLTRGYSYALTGDYRLGPPHPPLVHWWAALPGRSMVVKFPPLDSDAWRRSDVWTIGRQFFFSRSSGNPEIIDNLLFRGRVMIAILSSALVALIFMWASRLWGTAGGVIALTLAAFSPTLLAHGALVTTDCAVTLYFMLSLAAIWAVLHRLTLPRVALGAAAIACLLLTKLSAVLIIPTGLILLAIRLVRGGELEVRFLRRRRLLKSRVPQAACFAAVMLLWVLAAWGAIWAAYGFRYSAMRIAQPGVDSLYSNKTPPKGKDLWEYVLRGKDSEISPAFRRTIYWLRDSRLLPEAYVYSAAYAKQTARGRNSFLDGKIDLKGFRSFFPMTFLYKTPLPLLGLLAAAGAAPWIARREHHAARKEDRRRRWTHTAYQLSPLAVFFVVYWYASLSSVLNIGHRHILPTYPALFIVCGAVAPLLRAANPALRGVVPVLLGLYVIASVAIYPDYLAYFNVLAGGPKHGYRHLVDSSLDWGQDLPALHEEVLKRRRGEEPVYIAYFGSGGWTAVMHEFNITQPNQPGAPVWLPGYVLENGTGVCDLRPGLYAISATQLQQVYAPAKEHRWSAVMEEELHGLREGMSAFCQTPNTTEQRKPLMNAKVRKDFARYQALQFARLCTYLRAREPDAFAGYSILLYDLDETQLKAALEGPVETVPAESAEEENLAQPAADP